MDVSAFTRTPEAEVLSLKIQPSTSNIPVARMIPFLPLLFPTKSQFVATNLPGAVLFCVIYAAAPTLPDAVLLFANKQFVA